MSTSIVACPKEKLSNAPWTVPTNDYECYVYCEVGFTSYVTFFYSCATAVAFTVEDFFKMLERKKMTKVYVNTNAVNLETIFKTQHAVEQKPISVKPKVGHHYSCMNSKSLLVFNLTPDLDMGAIGTSIGFVKGVNRLGEQFTVPKSHFFKYLVSKGIETVHVDSYYTSPKEVMELLREQDISPKEEENNFAYQNTQFTTVEDDFLTRNKLSEQELFISFVYVVHEIITTKDKHGCVRNLKANRLSSYLKEKKIVTAYVSSDVNLDYLFDLLD